MKNMGALLKVRLELHDNSKNSHKYYILDEVKPDLVEIRWGRCGKRGGSRQETRETALELLRQKQLKGYEQVGR